MTMPYFETDEKILSERIKIEDPDIFLGDNGVGDSGWYLQHAINLIEIIEEPKCSFKRTIKQLTDLTIRHTFHKFGINDRKELNYMIYKYGLSFAFLKGASP